LIRNKKRILLVNDDGVHSPGIRAAAEALSPIAEVLVAAPSKQQTGMGASVWGQEGDYFREIPFETQAGPIQAYHTLAAPARIIQHALNVLCYDSPPDLIVSGINYGENMGAGIIHSGTVGAALNGCVHGHKSIAISLQTKVEFHIRYGEVDWSAAQHFLRHFAEKMLNSQIPEEVDCLKIDVPDIATPQTGWCLAKLSRVNYFTMKPSERDPSCPTTSGKLELLPNPGEVEEGSDIDIFTNKRKVSVTPLTIDSTSRTSFENLSNILT
jgi:5'-nucleotidase